MSNREEQKLVQKSIPGTMNREQRFAKVEHAENTGETLKRIAVYFGKERGTVCGKIGRAHV